jgi:tRNA pseudouridine65 synthase
LQFTHPVSGAPMQIEAPLDQACIALLDRFGWPRPPFGEGAPVKLPAC